LNRFIANLLDMTKLESGAIEPNLRCMISAKLSDRRCGARQDSRRPSCRAQARNGLPMIAVDAVLFEQALFNLLDNAQVRPGDTTIFIRTCGQRLDLSASPR